MQRGVGAAFGVGGGLGDEAALVEHAAGKTGLEVGSAGDCRINDAAQVGSDGFWCICTTAASEVKAQVKAAAKALHLLGKRGGCCGG